MYAPDCDREREPHRRIAHRSLQVSGDAVALEARRQVGGERPDTQPRSPREQLGCGRETERRHERSATSARRHIAPPAPVPGAAARRPQHRAGHTASAALTRAAGACECARDDLGDGDGAPRERDEPRARDRRRAPAGSMRHEQRVVAAIRRAVTVEGRIAEEQPALTTSNAVVTTSATVTNRADESDRRRP